MRSNHPSPAFRDRVWLIGLLLLYVAAGVWMMLRLPAQAAPNELLHYEYIHILRQTGQLPQHGLVNTDTHLTELHQPPLYYALATALGRFTPPTPDADPSQPLSWQTNPAFLNTHRGNLSSVVHVTPTTTPLLYVGRLATLLLSLVGLAAIYRVGAQLYEPALGLLMVSLLAFQPNLLHLSASVNNDAPLVAISAVAFATALWLIATDKSAIWYAGLGLVCASAVITKASGLFLLSFVGMACLLLLVRTRDLKRVLLSGISAVVGFLPLWLGWLAINATRDVDTLGVANSLPLGRLLTLRPADFAALGPWLDDIGRSFWLDWSAGGVGTIDDWFYLLWAWLLLVALLGWLKRGSYRDQVPLLALALSGIATLSLLYLAVKALTVKEAGYLVPEGRWWLPMMPAVVWLVAVGFARWWSPRWRKRALTTASLIPAASTILLLLFFLPALYPQARPRPNIVQAASEEALVYGEEVVLLATAEEMVVGNSAEIDLVWSALSDIDTDYLVAAQLLVPAPDGWQKLDEQYTYPGYGANPTSGWQADTILQDALTFVPQGSLNGPTEALVVVDLRHADQPLPARKGDQPIAPPVMATTVVRPSAPLQPTANLSPVAFGEGLQLVGVESHSHEKGLGLTLWWQATDAISAEATVFVHLLDSQGELVAQADGSPNRGLSPFGVWRAGDVVKDERWLDSAEVDAGSLSIGVYLPSSGQRLPAVQNGQPLPNSAVVLPIPPQ